jgi:hypothetical protein
MSYKAFSTAMRTSSRKSGLLPSFRDETLEQQRQRKIKEQAEQSVWHQRWLRGEKNNG